MRHVHVSLISWHFVCSFHASWCVILPHKTVKPGQDGRHFADDIFKCIFGWHLLYFDSYFTEVCLWFCFDSQSFNSGSCKGLSPYTWWSTYLVYIWTARVHDDVIKWKHFSALLALCAGNSPVTGELPSQRLVTRSFDVLFDLRLNKLLSNQSWDWWFETPSRPLWSHCNVYEQPRRYQGFDVLYYVPTQEL